MRGLFEVSTVEGLLTIMTGSKPDTEMERITEDLKAMSSEDAERGDKD